MNKPDIVIIPEIQSVVGRLGVKLLNEMTDFCIYSFSEEQELNYFSLDPYRQLYYELVIDITDTCSFILEGKFISPCRNRITLIKPFQLQTIAGNAEPYTGSSSKGFIIYFTADFMDRILGFERMPILNGQDIATRTFSDDEMIHFEAIASELYKEYRNYKGYVSRQIIKNYLEIFIYRLQQSDVGSKINLNKGTAAQQLHLAFVDAVNERFLTLTTVKEYASLLNVSAKHLSETIKQECNVNALSIIRNARLNHSKTLLLQTGKTVAEIADELNFSDANNFTSFFRELTLQTPSQFRKIKR